MELKQKRWDNWQKSQLILVAAVVALVIAISGTLAWFTTVRKIQTATLVDMPQIYIEGPQGETSQLLPLGDIDVTNGTSREYVFRIVTKPDNEYRVQLAHTTNVPFVYTIYPASESNSDGSGIAVATAGHTYYYNDTVPLGGELLDKKNTHEVTYETSSNAVQSDAEPLYWQSETVTQSENYSYYVLKVSWNEGLKNNKETDMVYLTVKLA